VKRDPVKAKAWRARSKPLSRSAIGRNEVKKPGATLRPVSMKMARKRLEARDVRRAYLAAHPICEIGAMMCTVRSSDVHEPWTRARGGPIDDPRNMAALCRPCHGWVTFTVEGQQWATARGFLVGAARGPAWLEAGGRDA